MGEGRSFGAAVLILCLVLGTWLLLHSSGRGGLVIGVLMSWPFLAGLCVLGFLWGLVAGGVRTALILCVVTALTVAFVHEVAMLGVGSPAARSPRLFASLIVNYFLPVAAGGMVGCALLLVGELLHTDDEHWQGINVYTGLPLDSQAKERGEQISTYIRETLQDKYD